MTRFEQFQQNVQTWATERGIYEHSTALAQALKAVSEVGELADAVIKGDREGLKDAIGDVAVCLVNVNRLEWNDPLSWSHNWAEALDAEHGVCLVVGQLAEMLDMVGEGFASRDWVVGVINSLYAVAKFHGLDFDDCCEHAWQQIKDRKGRMVAGGAFVKEDE